MPTLLKLENITKKYPKKSDGFFGKKEFFTAVDNINLEINRGEIMGLIGESGSGKSTIGKLIMRLTEPTSGSIHYNEKKLTGLSHKEMLPYYRNMQMIFQDSGSSFNPRKPIGKQLITPMQRLGIVDSVHEAETEIYQLLQRVGLKKDHINRYPHEFSGGQRQRLGIARALALKPEFLVLDEPTSALDVSIQAQILNLLLDLQEEFDLTYLFIGHNLSVIRFFCSRVAVMYKGKMVEVANSQDLYVQPKHPVSEMLLNSVLSLNAGDQGEPSFMYNEKTINTRKNHGCVFAEQCQYAKEACFESQPTMEEDRNRSFACYYPIKNKELVLSGKR